MSMQGYGYLSDAERRSLWLGLRFAPLLCFAGIALGAVLNSPAVLLAMAVTALTSHRDLHPSPPAGAGTPARRHSGQPCSRRLALRPASFSLRTASCA
jgi:hypothetical protein